MFNTCSADKMYLRTSITPTDATKPTRHPQTTKDLRKAPTPAMACYISVSPCKCVKKQSCIKLLMSNAVLIIRHKEGRQTSPCPRLTQPGKLSPEIDPSQPPPPKPGFGRSFGSCSLPNCSSLNSLPSSFLGEDLPHGITADCTTERKLK